MPLPRLMSTAAETGFVCMQNETGHKRYKSYYELLRREVDSWFVFDGSLPPINEMVYKPCFGCTEDQFRRSSKIIKDLYRRLKDI